MSSAPAEVFSTDEIVVPVVLEVKDSADWYINAIVFLSALLSKQPDELVSISSVGVDILQHAKAHLERRLRAYLCPSGLPRTEQQAMAMLKAIGQDLAKAGQDLHAAAERMKNKGDPYGANQARQAGTRALQAAEGLVN